MFEKLKSLIGVKAPVSQADGIPVADLKDRPLTLALLLRAAKEVAADRADLEGMVGKIRSVPEPPNLEARIDIAVYAVTMSIVLAAAKEAGCKALFLPTDPLPRDAPIVVAFGLTVLSAMHTALANEGYKFDARKATAELVTQMLLMHSAEERASLWTKGSSLFQQVTRADAPNVQGWLSNTINLVFLYLQQFTTDDAKLKEVKLLPLFGAQLKSFLAAGE